MNRSAASCLPTPSTCTPVGPGSRGTGCRTTANARNASRDCRSRSSSATLPGPPAQRSSGDDNPNVDYPEIEQRVAETYALRSRSTNKNSLYDSYKMAIRWGLRPHWRAGHRRVRHQRILAVRHRGLRRPRLSGRGVHVDLCHQPPRQSTYPRRALAARRAARSSAKAPARRLRSRSW